MSSQLRCSFTVLHLIILSFVSYYMILVQLLANFSWRWIAYNVLLYPPKVAHSLMPNWLSGLQNYVHFSLFTFLKCKKRNFLRICELLHAFSRTMPTVLTLRRPELDLHLRLHCRTELNWTELCCSIEWSSTISGSTMYSSGSVHSRSPLSSVQFGCSEPAFTVGPTDFTSDCIDKSFRRT